MARQSFGPLLQNSSPLTPVPNNFAWDQYLQNSHYFDDPFGVGAMDEIVKARSAEMTHFSPSLPYANEESSNMDYGQQAAADRKSVV